MAVLGMARAGGGVTIPDVPKGLLVWTGCGVGGSPQKLLAGRRGGHWPACDKGQGGEHRPQRTALEASRSFAGLPVCCVFLLCDYSWVTRGKGR